jgi:ribosomal protein S27AE
MYRDELTNCPRCAIGLDDDGHRLSCGQCHGELITEADLLERLRAAQLEELVDPSFRWRVDDHGPTVDARLPLTPARARKLRKEAVLACPRCAEVMTKHELYKEIVDRCPHHGVWLDGDDELAAILKRGIAH